MHARPAGELAKLVKGLAPVRITFRTAAKEVNAASMLALLPKGAGDTLVQQAEQRMQEPLNRDLLVLVGHPQRQQAIALVQRLGCHRIHAAFHELRRHELGRGARHRHDPCGLRVSDGGGDHA